MIAPGLSRQSGLLGSRVWDALLAWSSSGTAPNARVTTTFIPDAKPEVVDEVSGRCLLHIQYFAGARQCFVDGAKLIIDYSDELPSCVKLLLVYKVTTYMSSKYVA